MNRKFRFLLCALPASAGSASAQIDSGGGNAAVGNLTNHGSIGGIVATALAPLGPLTLQNGLIEILYAAAPLDPDADSDTNGLADVREDENFPGQNVVDSAADPHRRYRFNRPEIVGIVVRVASRLNVTGESRVRRFQRAAKDIESLLCGFDIDEILTTAGFDHCIVDPISPPSGPAQRLFQGPPTKSKILAARSDHRLFQRPSSRKQFPSSPNLINQ